jgi:Transglycosylase SLT domain
VKLGLLCLTTAALLIVPTAMADGVDNMPTKKIERAAQKQINNGAIYSSRWGDASPYLKRLCYELVDRAFAPFGTSSWAHYVVNRESDCNPGAINSSSGANGIAQILQSHTQYDHYRIRHDIRYAVRVFVHMSDGGRNTSPWRCC